MSGFSTYLSQNVINSTLRGVAFSVPSSLYLAVFSSDPTDDNVTVNEVSGAWYARQVTGAWAAPVGAGNSTSNNSQVQYAAVTGSAVTVTHWGIYDAASSGNLLYSGALTTPLDVVKTRMMTASMVGPAPRLRPVLQGIWAQVPPPIHKHKYQKCRHAHAHVQPPHTRT